MQPIYSIFSKIIDYALLYFFVSFLINVFPLSLFLGGLWVWFLPLLWAPLGACLMALWRTTPGRAVFGLHGLPTTLWGSLKQEIRFFYRAEKKIIGKKLGGRRLLVALLLTLCCVSKISYDLFWRESKPVSSQIEMVREWKLLLAERGKFRVYVPFLFEEHQILVGEGKLSPPLEGTEYISGSEESLQCTIGYVQFPRKWRLIGSRSLLERALDLFLQQEGITQECSRKMITHEGFPALMFSFEQDGKYTEGRLILIGNFLYKLTATDVDLKKQKNSMECFFGSFHFFG